MDSGTLTLVMTSLRKSNILRRAPQLINQRIRQANMLWEEMLRYLGEHNERVDVKMLTEYMGVFAGGGRVGKARRIFESFEEYGIAPDVVAYTQMMEVHAKRKDLPRVMQLVSEMKERRLAIDAGVYKAMISASVGAGQLRRALSYLKQMVERGM